MSSNYQHKTLTSPRSIRVLTLLPSPDEHSLLIGQFKEISLDSSPNETYEAVSYVWGPKEPLHTITIIEQDPLHRGIISTNIPIRLNCFSALTRLRHWDQPRNIWIDVVCIDQSSVEEKNVQVPLMPDIYAKAEQVLICLSEEEGKASSAPQVFDVMRHIGRLYKKGLLYIVESDEDVKAYKTKRDLIRRIWERHIMIKCRNLGDAFVAPFRNSYFRRIWTIQEIALTHNITVFYGPATIDWPDFATCCSFFAGKGIFNASVSSGLGSVYTSTALYTHCALCDPACFNALCDKADQRNMREKTERYCWTNQLERLYGTEILSCKGLEATDPKDQVYAMLWAVPKSPDNPTKLHSTDYNKSIATIYTEYTIEVMRIVSRVAEVLLYVNSLKRDPSLPSWVPDWNEPASPTHLAWSTFLPYRGEIKPNCWDDGIASFDGNLMVVRGFQHSAIVAKERFNTRPDLHFSRGTYTNLDIAINSVQSAIEFIGRTLQIDHAASLARFQSLVCPERLGDRPYESLCADRLGISINQLRLRVYGSLSTLISIDTLPSIDTIVDLLRLYFPAKTLASCFPFDEEYHEFPPFSRLLIAISDHVDVVQMLDQILYHYHELDLFITDRGDIGLTHYGVQKGDHVTLWQGFPARMIIRKGLEDELNRWRFHGVAHVDDVEDGDDWTRWQGEMREFVIM